MASIAPKILGNNWAIAVFTPQICARLAILHRLCICIKIKELGGGVEGIRTLDTVAGILP